MRQKLSVIFNEDNTTGLHLILYVLEGETGWFVVKLADLTSTPPLAGTSHKTNAHIIESRKTEGTKKNLDKNKETHSFIHHQNNQN